MAAAVLVERLLCRAANGGRRGNGLANILMPRFGRSCVHPFAEEDTVEAGLLGPVGLGVPVLGVVGQVFGHRRMGVEPYLWHVKGTGAVFGQGQQPGSDARPWTAGSTATFSSSR